MADNKPKLTTDDPDPISAVKVIVVDQDRYCGTYSNHKYHAWIGAVPDDASAGDSDCEVFWTENDVIFGGGPTPDEAIAALFQKLWGTNGFYPEYCPTLIFNSALYTPVKSDLRYIGLDSQGSSFYDRRIVEVYPKSAKLYREQWG
jgi:hypothetical protein